MIPIDLAVEGCGSHSKRMLTARSGSAGRDYQGGMQQETLGDRPGSGLRGGWVVWWMGQAPTAPSGRKWQGAQSCQGATQLDFPGPALGKMQSEAARRAERLSRPAIEKKRRRRVLVVTTCSPRPMRAVQRARLCAITWTASQAALAAKRKAAGSAFLGHPRESPRGRIHIMTLARIRWGINRVRPHRVSAQAVSRARVRRRSGCLPISTGKNSRRYRQD